MTAHGEVWKPGAVSGDLAHAKLLHRPRLAQNPHEMRYSYPESNHHNVTMTPERFGDSLKFTLGPRVNWLGVSTAVLLITIICGVGIAPAFEGLESAIEAKGSLGGYMLGITACSALILLIFYRLILNLFGSEVVTVSPTDLRIESLIWAFVRSRREFPNSTVDMYRFSHRTISIPMCSRSAAD